MEYNIAVVKGDGIGPEIVTEAMKAVSYTHLIPLAYMERIFSSMS